MIGTWPDCRDKPTVNPVSPEPPRVVPPRVRPPRVRPLPPRPPRNRPPPVRPANLPTQQPDEIVVFLDLTQNTNVALVIAQQYSLVHLRSETNELLQARIQRYRIPDRRTVAQVIAAMQGDARVDLVQPNFFYRNEGKRKDQMSDLQYSPQKLGLDSAHTLAQGRQTLVAVIDSGIDRSHPEFAGAIAAVYNAARGRKFEVDDHGTAVAGIIGARAQLKGVAPATRLLAVRAFFKEGNGGPRATTYILLRAIDWAQKNNARLINLSFAGPHDEALKRIVNEAYQRGTILVAAAGNGGPNAPAAYPAAYPGVLAITATDQDDNIYRDANRGGYVAIAAPGVDILVPVRDSGYDFKTGTSFAAAHVTGLIALMLERNPELSPDEVREILAGAAVDLGPRGPDKQFGAGRADAFIAIQAVVNGRRARRN